MRSREPYVFRRPRYSRLAARGFSTRRSYVTHAVTLIFPTDFRAKERLLAVYFRVCKTKKILLQLLSIPAVCVRHQLWSCVAHRAFPKLLLVQNVFRKIATNFLFWRLCQGLKYLEENLHTKLDIKKRFNARQCTTQNARLEPTTLRLRVSCSTDWASRAPCAQSCVKYRSENEYSSLARWRHARKEFW